MTVLERIESRLDGMGIPYRVTTHAPVYTSVEAAAARGASLAAGAKALIVKAGEEFVLFVVPGDRRMDSKAVKRILGVRALRFATREEVLDLTGLEPGAIPPFGSLFGLETRCDRALGLNASIHFNPGSHTASLEMAFEDYLRAEGPEVVDVTAPSQ
jgi:Ala-tRNA(Pro) deacylase